MLEERGRSRLRALRDHRARPSKVEGSRPWPALTADDYPSQPGRCRQVFRALMFATVCCDIPNISAIFH